MNYYKSKLLNQIENGTIGSLDEINLAIKELESMLGGCVRGNYSEQTLEILKLLQSQAEQRQIWRETSELKEDIINEYLKTLSKYDANVKLYNEIAALKREPLYTPMFLRDRLKEKYELLVGVLI